MYLTTSLIPLLAAATLALPQSKLHRRAGFVILDLEIGQDTFTSDTEVAVPGSITLDQELISAFIAEVDGISDASSVSCQAYDADGNKIGAPFTASVTTTFDNGNLVEISTVTCTD